MNREHEDSVALIDLGVASVETQGNGQDVIDLSDLQAKFGLSDD
jgi:hypothetical protein